MEEEVKLCLDMAKDGMEKAVNHLNHELVKIRTGKADPNILNDVHVDYYGASTPLYQLANVNTPDASTISIQPWDKSSLGAIEKAIMQSNLGLNPSNDGDLIRISIPPLTEERRKELVKHVKNLAENAKVGIRNSRRDANDELKKLEKDGLSEDERKNAEKKVQDLTNDFTDKVDKIVEVKENEIMEV
jgi:ribosome recycling factor